MTPRELEEYEALRATIRERGTARHWIVIVGIAAWAALALFVAGQINLPVATLIPLLVLAATFESIFALHTGVERVGRYVQVFFEQKDDVCRWEHTAMVYGRRFGGGGIDPLFSPVFWTATIFNLVPLMLSGPAAVDWSVVVAVHALFAIRIGVARNQSARQRATDLERFTKLQEESKTKN